MESYSVTKANKKRNKWALTTQLKYNWSLNKFDWPLSPLFSHAREWNNLISCFELDFYMWVFRFYFPLFSQMSAIVVQERKLQLHLVLFCPPKSVNSFMYIQFLGFHWTICLAVLKETEEIISFRAFLSVLHIKLRSFHL